MSPLPSSPHWGEGFNTAASLFGGCGGRGFLHTFVPSFPRKVPPQWGEVRRGLPPNHATKLRRNEKGYNVMTPSVSPLAIITNRSKSLCDVCIQEMVGLA